MIDTIVYFSITYKSLSSYDSWLFINCGGDAINRRSTTGSIIFLGNGPIQWKSKLQRKSALSTTEAEYKAAAATTGTSLTMRSVLGLRHILKEILGKDLPPTPLYQDNLGAISHQASSKRGRLKHIDIHHWRLLYTDLTAQSQCTKEK